MDQNNRYILSFDILPIGQQGNPLTVYSAHSNVPAALEALLQRPIDQFHTTSAASKKMPYIRSAKIFDLGKGLPVYSTESFSTRNGQTGGLFLKIEDPANPFASRQLSYNRGDEPWTRDCLLLMVFDDSGGGHMRPSNLLYRLLTECSGQTLTPGALDYNNRYVVLTIGYKLDGASVFEDSIVYPALAEQHYFSSGLTGFAKLVSLPADSFEKECALAKGLPNYYMKAYLGREAERGVPLVDMFSCTPGKILAGYPKLEPGRYLYFSPGNKELNRSLGVNVDAGDDMVLDKNVFMLDAWNKNGDGEFVQQPFGRAVDAAVARSIPDPDTLFDFTFCTYLHPLAASHFNNQHQSLTDLIDYHYTNDFSEALFYLLKTSVATFDQQSASRDENSFQLMECKLLDKAQRLVGGYMFVNEPGNFPERGVYLALHSELMQQPAIQALDLEVLKDGVQVSEIKQDDMLYFQAAAYRYGTLVINPGFEKLGLYHTWNHIAMVQANNPGARQASPLPVTDQDPYRLHFAWMTPQTDGPRFTYTEGFSTPWAALNQMELIPKGNFYYPAEAGEQQPLVLDKIYLCDQAGQAIITKGRDETIPGRLYLDYNKALANETVHEAFVSLINGKLAAGPQRDQPGDEKTPGKTLRSRKHGPGRNKGRGI